MEKSLQIATGQSLSQQERTDIEQYIDQLVAQHGKSRSDINRLVLDGVTALTVSEAKASELAEQGFFKRLWGGLSGKNTKLRADIDRNLAASQYASQQMIQKVAEQNLMTFDLVTAVNNKLNTMILEIDAEINNIYNGLALFFKQTRSDIVQMETRLDKLERNVNLLNWNATIEYQMFGGVEYAELNTMEKMVCVANDFYNITKGNWSTADLMLLKSTVSEIGVSVKEKLSYRSFIESMAANPRLWDRLFEGIGEQPASELSPYDSVLLAGTNKVHRLNGEERYIVDALDGQLRSQQIAKSREEIILSLTDSYIANAAQVDMHKGIETFDLIVELIYGLKQSSEGWESISLGNAQPAAHSNDEDLKEGERLYLQCDFKQALPYLVKSAEQANNPRAMFLLGEMHKFAEGVEKDHDVSADWHRRGADLGYALCLANVAYAVKGTDKEQAEKLFREQFEAIAELAESGDVFAQNEMGSLYEGGNGVDRDSNQALEWFTRSADNGFSSGAVNLGNLNYYADEPDYATGLKWYRQAADQGNARGMYGIGHAYYYGNGVEQDYYEAIDWLRKAAELGNVMANDLVGDMYRFGEGVNQDHAKALKFYVTAAKQGNQYSQYSLGDLYYLGKGVEQNRSKAAEWYLMAAEQGHRSAQNDYAAMALLGDSMPADVHLAVRWFKKAAAENHGKAQLNLAKIYHHGYEGINQDFREAYKWYRKAADNEVAAAMNNLACMYVIGEGVDIDYEEALALFDKAGDLDDEYAIDNLQLLTYDTDMWEYVSMAPKTYYVTEKCY